MQFSLRLKDAEAERIEALIGRVGRSRYEVVKRLFLLGLERVEIGHDPFNAHAPTRLEKQIDDLIGLLTAEFGAARARDFNLALDNVETRAWLRTLGELLAPNSTGNVTAKVQNSRSHFLSLLENLPPDAPAKRLTETP